MNFLKDDEFLVLMVNCEGRDEGFTWQYTLTVQDRIRLRNVGIQTAHEQPAWALIEPSKDNYNFNYLDNIIKRNRDAGLKSLIQLAGWRLPAWIPNEWRAQQKNGQYEPQMLSIWNEEAQIHSDKLYTTIMDHYTDPDICFFFGEFQGGEGAMPPSHCYYDHAALESFQSIYGKSIGLPDLNTSETTEWFGNSVINHFVRKSRFFYDRYKEVWNEQQKLMDIWNKSYGNYVQPDIMKKYRELFPDANIVLLQYTYFDSAHDEENVKFVDMLGEISGCETIVEAMFPKGLPLTTPKAIFKGFRGQIVQPSHEPGNNSLEEWAVDNIRNSHNLWLESKQ